MEVNYKQNLNSTHMILVYEQVYKEDYQIPMLKSNDLKGVLPVTVGSVDNKSQFYYDISGKSSMKSLYKKVKMEYEEICGFINQVLEVLKELQQYMLEVNHLILDPEYIFCQKDCYYFCYNPIYQIPIGESFHILSEYLVRQVDYEDKDAVLLTYELHKATMDENYNVNHIMKRVERLRYERKREEECNCEIKEITENCDWAENMKVKSISHKQTVCETKVFSPLKNILKKTKRNKWGDWKDLLLDKE